MNDAVTQALGRDVSRETVERLKAYVGLLKAENAVQNLVSQPTLGEVWSRHIADSAQLCRLAASGARLDVGSGAGLPGLIIGIIDPDPITLVEPRRLRADFLLRCVATLGLSNVDVACAKVEQVTGRYDFITARAVASLDKLFGLAAHLSHAGTRWVLPKGRSGAKELEEARRSWQGEFRLEPSLTDPHAVIVVAEQVRRRRR